MGLLQDLFRTHGSAHLEQFGATMPRAHQKVIAAIAECRTEAAGSTLYECETCGQSHMVHRSCGNHHVRFRYQHPHSHRVRTMTLPIMEFMRRFLQHVG